MIPLGLDEDISRATYELGQLLQLKRNMYGTENLKVFGELGILVRVFDKVYRLRNLYDKGEDPHNETIADSWRDIAGYAVLALLQRKDAEDSVSVRVDKILADIPRDRSEGDPGR